MDLFWFQSSETDLSALVGIAIVSILATASILYIARRSPRVVEVPTNNGWQVSTIYRFRHVATRIDKRGQFDVSLRRAPHAEIMHVSRLVAGSQKPIIMITIEISFRRGKNQVILVRHGGEERYFASGEDDVMDAIYYFRWIFTEMVAS